MRQPPHTTASLGDGSHTFEVRAIDNAGNTDATPDSHTWTVDATAPTTSITAQPSNPDTDATPTFQFTGADTGGSGVASYECRIDAGAWTACTSPHTTASLGDGSHTFEVRAIDNVGNTDSTPDSYTWTVDTTEPTTSITAQPSNPDNDATPTFQFTGTDTGGSGVASYECRIDAGSWAACVSPHTTASLGDGSHTFEVRAIDNAGNTDTTPDSYTWTVDATAPTTTISAQPSNPDNDTTPTFQFSGTDIGGSGVASYECRIDAGAWAACVSPHTTAILAAGSHTFEVRAIDNAGNTDASPDSYTWTLDTTAPTIVISAPSKTKTSVGPFTYTVTYTGADTINLTNGDITLNKTLTADGTVNVTNGTTSTPTVTISGATGDGTLGISIAAGTASDNAGNNAPTAGPSGTTIIANSVLYSLAVNNATITEGDSGSQTISL